MSLAKISLAFENLTSEQLTLFLNDARVQNSWQSITSLGLGSNNLTYLPKEIGSLVNLKCLDASNNKLESLPKEIGNLVNLRSLSFDSNNSASLPSALRYLVKLRRLELCLGNKKT